MYKTSFQCFWLLLAALAATSACSANNDPNAPSVDTSAKFITASRPYANRYIVRLDSRTAPDRVESKAAILAGRYGGEVRRAFSAVLRGFVVEMSRAQAFDLSNDSEVASVEEDGSSTIENEDPIASAETMTEHPDSPDREIPWGLDRIDARARNLDMTYNVGATGAGVHVYVLDTGIRITHKDFEGRASVAFDAIGGGVDGLDCEGHGTHVAGIVAGKKYGVAKNAYVHSVRVAGCDGKVHVSELIAGIEWVTRHHVKPAVVNLSIIMPPDEMLDKAVQDAIDAGITFVTASGNTGTPACEHSPQRVQGVINVGASDWSDQFWTGSNHDFPSSTVRCMDLIAPGMSVQSASHQNDTDVHVIGATSQAAPHVAGVAALYLQTNPTATPAQVAAAILAETTLDVLTDVPEGTVNKFLFAGAFQADPGSDRTAPTVAVSAPTAGGRVSGTVRLAAAATDDRNVSRVDYFVGVDWIGTATASPFELLWDSAPTPNGEYRLTAYAFDAVGNMGTSTVSVILDNEGWATYSPTLKAPECGKTGTRCDTGRLILASGSHEPNHPNTVLNSCAEWPETYWEGDPTGWEKPRTYSSIDRIAISSANDDALAAGGPAKAEITIYHWHEPNFQTFESFDLYSASDADNPEWERVGSWTSDTPGVHTFSTTFTLPHGRKQALRAVYAGAGDVCRPGDGMLQDDRDDLIFAVCSGR